METTVVVFRKWKSGDIIALMPEDPADHDGAFCNSYEHVGQHGAADYYGVVARTRRATEAEYADLAAELRRIGYGPDIHQRASSAMHDKRRASARALA
ncbi:MAG TPA: hypothetical protein VMY35_15965 [Phycisphaerae bacterium]|nr:hypothetical protein [Phycisphaerae bacterium]